MQPILSEPSEQSAPSDTAQHLVEQISAHFALACSSWHPSIWHFATQLCDYVLSGSLSQEVMVKAQTV
jgi:hypothetical protein